MTIISTTVGKNPLKKKWSSPHSQQNSLKCSTWVQSQTQQNDLCSFPRQTTQYHSNPSLCPNYHTRCSRTNTQKDVLFIIGYWNAKAGSQETPGVMGKFGLGIGNEAGQRLIVLPRARMFIANTPLPTTQEKTLHMDITSWTTPKSD